MPDWDAIKAAYEGPEKTRVIARAHKVDEAYIRRKARAGHWDKGEPLPLSPQSAPVRKRARPQSAPAADNSADNDSAPPLQGELIVPANRDAAGRFLKGASGNPNGRTAAMPEIVELARGRTKEVVRGLMEIARSSKHTSAARVRAYEIVAELGWGKAPATIFLQDNRDNPNQPQGGASEAVVAEIEAMLEGIASARRHDEAREGAEEATVTAAT